jgi:hypothetical protein
MDIRRKESRSFANSDTVEDDGFLRAIKMGSATSLGVEVKLRA